MGGVLIHASAGHLGTISGLNAYLFSYVLKRPKMPNNESIPLINTHLLKTYYVPTYDILYCWVAFASHLLTRFSQLPWPGLTPI